MARPSEERNPPPRDPASSIKAWIGRLALVFLAPALLFGIVELFAWALGVVPVATKEAFQDRESILECRWNPKHLLDYCNAPESDALDGRRSVLVVGGSSVAGYPYGESRVISHYLGEDLERRYPGEYLVSNLGVPCKDSIYVRNCVERIIETRPEMIVAYTGHNDFSGLMSERPRLQMWLGEHGWWLMEIRRWLANTRAWSILDSDRSARELAAAVEPRASLDTEQIDNANREILKAYEENLQKILEMARRHETEVFWVTPVSNLHDFPKTRGTGGWFHALAQARKTDPPPMDWEIAYAKGIEAFRRKEFAEAMEQFKKARDLSPRNRAPGLLNERLRELDQEIPDLNLIDFEAELDRVGLEEGIGCNFFGSEDYCDGVHPNPRTNRLIAEAIARRIAGTRQQQP